MRPRTGGSTSRQAPDDRDPGGLIGRSHESAALRHLLGAHRLVTVSGGAGIGKSRLVDGTLTGWNAAPWRHVVRVRWDAEAEHPGSLAAALAEAHGARPDADRTPAELAALWAGERTLLVLDDVDPVQAE
ncbi:regulator, partial [Streptomyces sp. SID5785]|nr:regulator [Streptomyces sp. SID5785]